MFISNYKAGIESTRVEELVIKEANEKDLVLIKDILVKEALPTTDIVLDIVHIYMFYSGKSLVGISGLENFKSTGLLRSVAVVDKFKKQGYGRKICVLTMKKAAEMGVKELYLLTLTAEPFFKSLGFEPIERSAAPKMIKSTSEFKTLCPESAVCMKKKLAAV